MRSGQIARSVPHVMRRGLRRYGRAVLVPIASMRRVMHVGGRIIVTPRQGVVEAAVFDLRNIALIPMRLGVIVVSVSLRHQQRQRASDGYFS